jgi:hypothetical protein
MRQEGAFMAPRGSQSDGRILKVSVKSHLKFTPDSEPASDAAVSELARIFGERFGESLKSGTNAASVRIGEFSGRKTASAETDIWFYCYYLGSDAATNAIELFTVLSAIAAAWANRDWRLLVPGLAEAQSTVSVEEEFFQARVILSRQKRGLAPEALAARVRNGWIAALILGILLGIGATMAKRHFDKPDVRELETNMLAAAPAKAAEPTPIEKPSAAPPVSVTCVTPTIRLSCPSRDDEDAPDVRRWGAGSR